MYKRQPSAFCHTPCIAFPATPRPTAAALNRPAFFAVNANFDAAASDTMPISTIAALPAASFGTSDPNAPTPRSAAADTAANAVAVACSGAGSSANADTAPSRVCTRPVSYTHLDVYKRQEMY